MTTERERPVRPTTQGSGQAGGSGEDLSQAVQQEVAQAMQPVVAELRQLVEEVGEQQGAAEPLPKQSRNQPGKERAPTTVEDQATVQGHASRAAGGRRPPASGTRPAVAPPPPTNVLEPVLTTVLEPVLGAVAQTVDTVQDTVGLEVLPSQARRRQVEERIQRLEALLDGESEDRTQVDLDRLEDHLAHLEERVGSQVQDEPVDTAGS